MNRTTRFVMLGGFLGAGKTTSIARLAGHYTARGLNVGLVTNDQAYNLVDTQLLRSHGFLVGEVPGACFCCKFDDLVETAAALSSDEIPDVIIAEPVGSCTDLFATVVQPLRALYRDRFEVGPLIVLLKPEHGKKILRNDSGGGFSPKAAYIFLKQLEEADVIAINKIDKLTADEQRELFHLVRQRFPAADVISMSAREGTGFEKLIEFADSLAPIRDHRMDVDYQVYARGEAELGWLNCQVKWNATDQHKFDLDQLVLDCVREIHCRLGQHEVEVAHLKVLGQTTQDTAIANLVASATEPELSLASEICTSAADMLVNARIATDPELIERIVQTSVSTVADAHGVTAAVGDVQRFRPAPPIPTHRL